MIRLHLFLFLFVAGVLTTFAQDTTRVEVAELTGARAFLKPLDSLVCAKDTVATIRLLEDFMAKFPNDGLLARTNQALAKLYVAQKRNRSAIEKLEYTLHYEPVNGCYPDGFNACTDIFTYYYPNDVKFNICKALIGIYLDERNFEKAQIYLDLASKECFPGFDCGNGVEMWQRQLSYYYADYYLLSGQRKKALEVLLPHLIQPYLDSDKMIAKIYGILIRDYSHDEIAKEIDRGISKLKVERNYDYGKLVKWKWFDCDVTYLLDRKSKPKNYIRNERNVLNLLALNK